LPIVSPQDRTLAWRTLNQPQYRLAMSDRGDILLVDDEPMVGTILSRYLAEAGYRVHQVRSGAEALRAMRDGAEGVRTVVTDLHMGGMSGLDLARELTRRYPETRVLFIAGYPWEGEPLPGPLLLKPFTGERLVEAVRQLLATGPPGQSLTAKPRKRK
jgi:CheY-like chemotaxis protein